jgi:GH18 family chitinase
MKKNNPLARSILWPALPVFLATSFFLTACNTGSNTNIPATTADSTTSQTANTTATSSATTSTASVKTTTVTVEPAPKQNPYWVTGYLPGYNQDADGKISYMTALDWKTVTHVIHNAAMPNADGTLDTNSNSVGKNNRTVAIKTAHDAGVPILFSILGGISVYQGVVDNPALRSTLIKNLLAIMDEGYDGLDIDLEPIVKWGETENPGYETFIHELHTALQSKPTQAGQRPLLTIASSYTESKLLARLQPLIDQINIMTYDESGTMQGIVWHDSPLYDGDYRYPSTGNPVISTDHYVKSLLNAGIPAYKLGMGISLETRLWIGGTGTSTGGATAPLQTWKTPPRHFMTSSGVPQPSYAELMDKYYKPENAHWDEAARVPYLSFDNPGSDNDMFISYNDERSVAEKIHYMQDMGMGGLMLWTLEKDYRPSQPLDKQRPIMQAIRQTLAGT